MKDALHIRSDVVVNNESVLSLYQQRLSLLPESIWQQMALEVLNVADNELSVLPDGVGKLTRLRMQASAT